MSRPRRTYSGRVKPRFKTALKIIIYAIIGLAVVSIVCVLWFMRSPTTQLVDASGKKLTAGSALQKGQEVLGDSLFDEARAHIKKKDFAVARERLLKVIEESDRDGEACILLCDVSRELKEVVAAADYGLKAVELLPDSAEAHLAYAKALGAQLAADMQSVSGMFGAMKRLGLFKEELNRVIELNPEDTEARAMLVLTNMAPKPMGDIDRAIELCEEIEARDPVMGKQLLAMCHQSQKKTDRAIELLQEGIEKFPAEAGFHVALADIYAEEKRFDAADAEYEAARRGEKGKAYYRSLYGQARMRIQNQFEPALAVELLDEFIMGEPESDGMQSVAHAYWRKGNALEQLGRKQEARNAYEESLRRNPDLELARKAIAGLQE